MNSSDQVGEMDVADIAKELALENIKSICCRYPDHSIKLKLGGTVNEHIQKCRNANPLKEYSYPESFQYLSCYIFQSCKHSGWQISSARSWIMEAQIEIGHTVIQEFWDDQHVWTVPDEL